LSQCIELFFPLDYQGKGITLI